jgi:protoporphyrinogen oxidase
VSTLPLDHFLSMLNPPPGRGVGQLITDLKYRSIIIVALFLNKNSVSENASIYFPDADIPFTRIHEPKNRSRRMSPEGKTSLIVEIPCQKDDVIWKASDEKLIERASSELIQAGLIAKDEIIGSLVKKMPYAYPILEAGFEEKLEDVNRFLHSFSNLAILGRNGKFVYGHIHDMMSMGRAVIERYRD